MIELNATIKSIHKEFNTVSVFHAIAENGKKVRMVGNSDSLFITGEHRTFFGDWEKYHIGGNQFRVKNSEPTSVTDRAVKSFLTSQAGIGPATAKKLINQLGEDLPRILDKGDHKLLMNINGIGEAVALQALYAWHKQGDKSNLIEFIRKPLEDNPEYISSLTKSILKAHEFYQHKTLEMLKLNPYILWAFSSWKETDQLALALGIEKNDRRRMVCAFEESLYRLYCDGHTASSTSMVNESLKTVLGKEYQRCLATYEAARDDGLNTKRFFIRDNGGWSLKSSLIMEEFVRVDLLRRSRSEGAQQLSLLGKATTEDYLLPGGNALDTKQALAVNKILNHGVVAIIGGAGTGKTSVLYAANDLLHQTGRQVLQVALSGKAAQRLQQQTNQEAFTIESLLSNFKKSPRFLDNYDLPVLFIDEASMVDLPLMYRVLQAFKDREVKIVVIGDRGQLPPIGPGLVFHKMIESNIFPIVELTTNYRTLGGSTIPQVSEVIREGGSFETSKDVEHFECIASSISDETVNQYLKNKQYGTIQIISATKRIMAKVNRKLQDKLLDKKLSVIAAPEFRVGDKVIYKRNSPHIGLVNGSMGVVVETRSYDVVTVNKDTNETVPADIVIDFVNEGRTPLLKSQIRDHNSGEWLMQLSYALTGHQAQGSEFDCVIVALEKSQVLDRSWLYTAATRAKEKVIFVGDIEAIQTAIDLGNKADNREVCLRFDDAY